MPRTVVRDSSTPFVRSKSVVNQDVVLTQALPDGRGIRQPEAEAWVLIFVNMQRLGLAPPGYHRW